MSKSLGFYAYAPALLEAWDEFYRYDYTLSQQFGKPCLRFKWKFKKYCGNGTIYFYENTKTVRNKLGDNDSIMNITEPDFRIVDRTGLKHYSTLYNEAGLEEVFNRVLAEYFSSFDDTSYRQ